MFTGIVEEVGKIDFLRSRGKSAHIRINCKKVLEGSNIGDSIAVNGICLTAITLGSNFFEANISYETLERSSLKTIQSGFIVNLERALTLTTRLGGHLVQGHVDCIGTVANITKQSESYVLKINYPSEIDKYIVEKGSVTIDGISLTVAKNLNYSFEVAVIPHTFENTNLKYKTTGAVINLEVDQIARYIEKLLKSESKNTKLKSLVDLM